MKQTLLKALQILDSIRNSISAENTSEKQNENNNLNESQISNDINNDIDQIMNKNKEINNEIIPQNKSESNSEINNKNNEIIAQNKSEVSSESDNFVPNLFYHSPSPAKPYHKKQSYKKLVTPKSEVKIDLNKNQRKVSMTFGDGTQYAFKSVCFPSNKSIASSVNNNMKKRRRKSSIAEQQTLCSKTAIIRQMFADEERKENISNGIIKSKPEPDWNSIHNKGMDIFEWSTRKGGELFL